MPRMYSAYEFRRRAREAMLPVMSVLVLVMLIAMAPGLISNTLTMITGADPAALLTDLWTQERVGALFGADEAAALAAQEEFTAAVTTFLAAKWPILLLTAAVTLILGPVLTLGLNHTLLKALRREEFAVGTVFARLPVFFKAIGLTLMTDLRILLWSLPGTAVMLLGSLAMLWVPTLGMLLFLGGMVLTTVHSIQAAYRYRMAVFVMADVPETGINAAAFLYFLQKQLISCCLASSFSGNGNFSVFNRKNRLDPKGAAHNGNSCGKSSTFMEMLQIIHNSKNL